MLNQSNLLCQQLISFHCKARLSLLNNTFIISLFILLLLSWPFV